MCLIFYHIILILIQQANQEERATFDTYRNVVSQGVMARSQYDTGNIQKYSLKVRKVIRHSTYILNYYQLQIVSFESIFDTHDAESLYTKIGELEKEIEQCKVKINRLTEQYEPTTGNYQTFRNY